MTKYIAIDESGSMTTKYVTENQNRWFTISMVVLKKPKQLKKTFKRWISKNMERLERLDRNNKMFDEAGAFKELKTSLLHPKDKINLLHHLCQNDYFEVILVTIDNSRVDDKLYKSTARAFNYILGLALRYYLNRKVLPHGDYNLYIDERNTKSHARSSLEDYLNTLLSIEYDLLSNLKIEYQESHENYFIQIADFFANLHFSRKHNKQYNNAFELYKEKGYLHYNFNFPPLYSNDGFNF